MKIALNLIARALRTVMLQVTFRNHSGSQSLWRYSLATAPEENPERIVLACQCPWHCQMVQHQKLIWFSLVGNDVKEILTFALPLHPKDHGTFQSDLLLKPSVFCLPPLPLKRELLESSLLLSYLHHARHEVNSYQMLYPSMLSFSHQSWTNTRHLSTLPWQDSVWYTWKATTLEWYNL